MNEQDSMKDVSTSEVLLTLLDKSESWLDRMTKYAGWTFFFLFMFVFLLSFVLSFVIQALGAHYSVLNTVGWISMGLIWAVLIVYWYMYYKIKGENDAWKARIRELRRREEGFLMGR
ncbi:MAG: hypothetical protein E3J35_06110 [Methanomassiliicoccales archaeon]|nr:MAG: hypothetical protein E3J35_06110 [Methanomassiliicoccales archaeon]